MPHTVRFAKIPDIWYNKTIKYQVQIAYLNGHLCHNRRPACDLNSGQPGTH